MHCVYINSENYSCIRRWLKENEFKFNYDKHLMIPTNILFIHVSSRAISFCQTSMSNICLFRINYARQKSTVSIYYLNTLLKHAIEYLFEISENPEYCFQDLQKMTIKMSPQFFLKTFNRLLLAE